MMVNRKQVKNSALNIRHLLSLSLLGLLCACGGGSGGVAGSPEDEHNTSSPNQNPSPAVSTRDGLIATQKSLADNLYEGSREELPLTIESTGLFLNSGVFGLFPNEAALSPDNHSPSDWIALQWLTFIYLPKLDYIPDTAADKSFHGIDGWVGCGGTAAHGRMHMSSEQSVASENLYSYNNVPQDYPQKDTNHHYVIEYENCQHLGSNKVFNGKVEAYFSETWGAATDPDRTIFDLTNAHNASIDWTYVSPTYYDVVFAFQDLEIISEGNPITVNGVLDWPRTDRCGTSGLMSITAHLYNQGDGRSVFLDDFKIGSKIPLSGDCYPSATKPSYKDGRIHLSGYGSATIETPESTLAENEPSATRLIELHSAGDIASIDTAALAPEEFEYLLNEDYLSTSAILKIDKTETTEDITFKVISQVFYRGGLLALTDSDEDGMHDSWELAGGLNPNNAEDVDIDSDMDSVSNKIEYVSQGDPASARSKGINSDLSITEYTKVDSIISTERIALDLALSGQFYSNDPDHEFLVLSANVDGQWHHEHIGYCNIEKSANELHCSYSIAQNIMYASFTPSENGKLTITGELVQPEFDYVPDNNSISIEVEYSYQ